MASISPVNFSSGLDVRGIVDSLMQAERLPINQITAQKSGIQSKITEYGRILAARATAEDAFKAAGALSDTTAEADMITAAKKAVEEFNSMQGKIRLSTGLKATLQGDSGVSSLRSGIRSSVSNALYSQDITPLRSYMKMGSEGYLTFDEAGFKAAMAADSVTARSSFKGFFDAVSPELSKASAGASRIESLTTMNQQRIATLDKKVERIEVSLETVEKTLMKKFSALQEQLTYMERAMNPGQLNALSTFSYQA